MRLQASGMKQYVLLYYAFVALSDLVVMPLPLVGLLANEILIQWSLFSLVAALAGTPFLMAWRIWRPPNLSAKERLILTVSVLISMLAGAPFIFFGLIYIYLMRSG